MMNERRRADGGVELDVGAAAVVGEDQVVEHHLVGHELGGRVAGERLDHVGDELVLVRRRAPGSGTRRPGGSRSACGGAPR